MTSRDTACVHVTAFDRLQNATPERIACSGPLAPPPMPDWSGHESQVEANPVAPGLVGLDSWFWLAPTQEAMTFDEHYRGIDYIVTAVPSGADWDFGDGAGARFTDSSGDGRPYPQPSSVTHTYQAHNQSGYAVKAAVQFAVTWTAVIHNHRVGPYALGTVSLDARPLRYQVEQAQPELVALSDRGQDADQPAMPSTDTATTGPPGLVERYWA
jgi:hypothetical protein